MAKVFLHTRDSKKHNWQNEFRDFARIPTLGEYVALSTHSEYYLVQLVVHVPFPADCEAEVYAVKVDHMEAKKRAFYDLDE